MAGLGTYGYISPCNVTHQSGVKIENDSYTQLSLPRDRKCTVMALHKHTHATHANVALSLTLLMMKAICYLKTSDFHLYL